MRVSLWFTTAVFLFRKSNINNLNHILYCDSAAVIQELCPILALALMYVVALVRVLILMGC